MCLRAVECEENECVYIELCVCEYTRVYVEWICEGVCVHVCVWCAVCVYMLHGSECMNHVAAHVAE